MSESMPEVNISVMKLEKTRPRVSEFRRVTRAMFRRRVVVGGTIIILMLIVAAVFAPLIAPFDPYEQDLNSRLAQALEIASAGDGRAG